jgi:hypothetical protein
MPDILHKVGIKSSSPDDVYKALGDSNSVARVAADGLCLAATPTFTIMALLAAVGGGQPDILCSAAEHTSPLSGMVPMYVLMSVFHSPVWLKLMSSRRKPRGVLRVRAEAAVRGMTA